MTALTRSQKSGTLCYYIDGKEGKMEAGQKRSIPPYMCHTVRRPLALNTSAHPRQFWNDPTTGTDLIVHITVRGTELHGVNSGFDDKFVRASLGSHELVLKSTHRCTTSMATSLAA